MEASNSTERLEHRVSMAPEPFKAILPRQEQVANIYGAAPIQIAVAVLIFGNFIVSAAQAQVLPEKGDAAHYVFLAFELFFNVAFTIELIVNMYGRFFFPFWNDAWNWFDFIIVTISLLSMALEDLPGISVLRLFRAFRVFRLFKRIKSLKLIIEGVMASLPDVSYAFIVLGVIMAIWSIMGVNFFGDEEEYQYLYGNFAKAMLTQFQIMTLDSWASQIAWPIVRNDGAFYCIFFISYIFVTAIMMMNVVVAILLDKFVNTMSQFNATEELIAIVTEGVSSNNWHRLEEAFMQAAQFSVSPDLVNQVWFNTVQFIDTELTEILKHGKDGDMDKLDDMLTKAADVTHILQEVKTSGWEQFHVSRDLTDQAKAILDAEEREAESKNKRSSLRSSVRSDAGETSQDLPPLPGKSLAQDTEILLEQLAKRTRQLCRRLDKSTAMTERHKNAVFVEDANDNTSSRQQSDSIESQGTVH